MKKLVFLVASGLFLISSLGNAMVKEEIIATISPVRPKIQLEDFPIDENTIYKKNWFEYSLSIENNTNTPITIVSFGVKVIDLDYTIKKNIVFNPTQFPSNPNEDYFEEIAPNSKSKFINTLSFVVDDISEPKYKDAYRFKIFVKVLGWKGSYNNAVGPLRVEATASTH